MFKPNFRYTEKMVSDLTQIAAARELILNSPFIPQWKVALRRETIIRSAHSSTAIEGNKLTLEQVTDLADGREVIASRKDKQEALNYLSVLEKIDKLTDGNKITEKNILNIHKLVTERTLNNPSDCGAYRSRYVVVARGVTGEIIFRPPSNTDVPELMRDLIDWLNSPGANSFDPVIEAGIAHYEFVRIHPFIDGNGRTARVVATLILYLRGFDAKQFFCLDDYYDTDRVSYYRALQTVDQKTLDTTRWLEYFVEGVNASTLAVKERIVRLSSERLRTTKKGQIPLTERQMRIVEKLAQSSGIRIGEVASMFKVTRQAALKEMNKLGELGVVKLVGKGRGAHYVLQ
ncbi:Fic family protein [candidate division TA06 bacterium]|uniref:Fic family protein n=1 Tax=candidate division TA06 bacterium TaxID=2250710 RepID=A0A523UUM5_UNCT6|nr:MAG: Fic family protein [candidate division TA06 bacterium]